ncbi:amidohydrolase [Kribbella sp. CA-293567]|uniref:amidohydrolase n=1 Tax=Kribbella sp. CA-293567 TaxID=3002436 RepID=UPI0022DDBCEB|nr:amidohydrolase [Kribbella sp. CA-293567]WBQ05357.1 amidohydrolase [Kribbella sp. CA-293567]
MITTLFTNGTVFDGRTQHPDWSVAVQGGRITAAGPAGDGRLFADLRGPATEVIDLRGGLLLPGFVDAHVHPVQGGLERARCDLSPVSGREATLATIAAYVEAHPDVEWILGGGWHQPDYPGGTPTAADLDLVTGDRPAFLVNADHHGAWANSRALALAGLDARTPDPADGRIERDHDGNPTGTLHEGAMDLVGRLVPPTTHEEQVAALVEAQAYLHSMGVTGWQDAILGDYANLSDSTPAYVELARAGRLTARVNGALWWRRDRGAEQIPELIERRDALRFPRLRAGSVKIMQDGVVENFTAGLLDPYWTSSDPTAAPRPGAGCGCGSGSGSANVGLSFVDPLALRDHVTALDAAGFQVHVHAIGDRAVREALDAFEAARSANGDSDLRHHIAHLQVVHPEDLGRFAALGVAANLQALWAVHEPQMDELTIPFLGPERTRWQYPFGALARSGARLAAGSDWPVSSPDPLAAVQVAVNRHTGDGEYEAFLPEQALDLATALAAYTAGSAWVNHADETGRIAPGLLADLAVLDRDPFAGPMEEIGSARVVATFVEGECVYGT